MQYNDIIIILLLYFIPSYINTVYKITRKIDLVVISMFRSSYFLKYTIKYSPSYKKILAVVHELYFLSLSLTLNIPTSPIPCIYLKEDLLTIVSSPSFLLLQNSKYPPRFKPFQLKTVLEHSINERNSLRLSYAPLRFTLTPV